MSIVIIVHQKGIRAQGIQRMFLEEIKKKYPDAECSIMKKEPAVSRADRFSEALGLISDGKSQMEELRDEMHNWQYGLPENLQSSQKADEIQSCIDELVQVISSCEEAEGASVEFPEMMG